MFASQLANAQTQSIIVDTTITTDCEFFPFGSVDTIYGLSFSGSVVLNSDSSLVRLVYIDGENNEWLLMEAYTLITSDTNTVYSKHCDETCYFDANPTTSIVVEIIDASVTVDTLFSSTVLTAQAPQLQQQAKYNMDIEKVTSMNEYIEENNLRWTAEYNSVSGLWYFDKKHMLGEKYNYLGFEYYGGGIFETVYTDTDPVQTDMVPYFDWRNRHDANVEGTPYFDGDNITFTGWLTPIKNQGNCGACWAFSTTAAVEAVSNIYYNNTNTAIEPNLSEQELISCSLTLGYNDCDTGGFPSVAFEYIHANSIINEECFLYESSEVPCDDPDHCATPNYVTSINNFTDVNDSDLDLILETLITKGALQVTMLTSQGPHGVSLIGYHHLKATGEIFWLIENSWGDWGDNGTAWIIRDQNLLNPKAVVLPVTINYADSNDNPERVWRDEDNDGIYWWGIGDMPPLCPGDPNNPDCNDNDPAYGGYDENYNCECLMPYQNDPFTITEDITWFGPDQEIDSDIEIELGATLTIYNTVKLTENARIIVKRGAKLIVDGGHLTNLCPNKWLGIEVWGTGDAPQDQPRAQGVVELLNGAIIENAKIGIAAIKRSNPMYGFPLPIFPDHSGGIVLTSNSTIRNCATAVRHWPYPCNTTSLVENSASTYLETDFIAEADYYNMEADDAFKAMVYLDGINGITFESVNLSNNQLYENRLTTDNPDYGIYANNSTFYLTKSLVNNRIEKFTYGIFSISSTSLNGFTSIRETEFINNKTGAYISHPYNFKNNIEILFNEFTTLAGANFDWSTGLYLDNTSKFTVEENEFFGDRYNTEIGDVNTPVVSYGIVVNNCGLEDNWLYNNYVYGCDRGIQAQYSNRSNDGRSGLQIRCNDYDVCEFDTYIAGKQPMLDSYGIAENQGSDENNTEAPAGNTFFYDNNVPDNDILNNTHDIIYWYHAITNSYPVIPQEYSEDLVHPNANFIDPQSYYKPLSCSTHYTPTGGRDAQSSKTNMLANEVVADSISNELSLLVDAGDTELMNDDVITSWPDETMELRQELLDASPYLSDSVMMSAADKENVLPNSILTEVLVANPQSAKSNNVMEAVDERDTLLNQIQYDQVMAGRLIAGAKEKLESRLTAARSKRAFAMKNLIMAWHEDSLVSATDSIINLLQNEERVYAKYTLVDEYLSIHDTVSANSMYNAIDSDFDLNNEEFSNWMNYDCWLDYRLKQMNRGKGISEPDSLQLVSLYQLYNNTSNHLKAAVRNLLRFADTLTYYEPYLTVDTIMKMAKVRARPVGNNPSENELLVYPNPARDYFIIDYSGLPLIDDQLYVEIFSLYGKPFLKLVVSTYSGFKVIDTRLWKPGVYVVSVHNDGMPMGAKNVIITQ